MKAKARKAWERANVLMDHYDARPVCVLADPCDELCPALYRSNWYWFWHNEAASIALDGFDVSELP